MASRTKAGTFAGTGEGMALSDAKIRNAKPKGHRYRLADTHGLSLEISPSGNRFWRYRYRINGKENLFAAGEWCQAPIGETPEQAADRQQAGRLTLAEARQARVTWRGQVKAGQHPQACPCCSPAHSHTERGQHVQGRGCRIRRAAGRELGCIASVPCGPLPRKRRLSRPGRLADRGHRPRACRGRPAEG